MKQFLQRHKKRILALAILFVIMIGAVPRILIALIFPEGNIKPEPEQVDATELQALPMEEENPEETEPESMEEELPEAENYATSHKENTQKALTDVPVELTDIYAEKDSIAVFHCFYPDAEQYTWEIYDMTEGWTDISPPASELNATAYDELYREVSSTAIPATEENNERMIRCTAGFKTKESITNTAVLYVLEKEIVSISAADFHFDTGQYISTKDIPVNVTYQDGTKEEITGLNNLFFLETTESSEYSTSDTGNFVETVMTVKTSCEYSLMEPGEKEALLRYQGSGEGKSMEAPIKMTGEDLSAPVISQVTISDFTVSNIDKPVPVTVSIEAEDNNTPLPNLEYAFLPEGQELNEDDWNSKFSFAVDITQNGKWIAYCRDRGGNIATLERDIIAVDNKAPVISLSLKNDSWCPENKIIVNATDKLSMDYRFSCAETGEDSGWIIRNEYDIQKNGTWEVKVRDAAGNIAEQEISVDNIDNQKPVIKKINEIKVTNGGITINEKK